MLIFWSLPDCSLVVGVFFHTQVHTEHLSFVRFFPYSHTNSHFPENMFTALKKIKKPNNAKPDDLETQVAQAIFKLEVDAKEVPVKSDLQAVHFVAAKEVRINKQKKAILIFVPPRQMSIWQRLHTRIVRELEKKFSGRHVLIIGQRKALKKPTNPKVKRPRYLLLFK